MSQQQEISIAAAEVLRIASSGEINFSDQDLQQRITTTLTDIVEKCEQVVIVENEIGTLKERLAPLLGFAFIHRVEENPVWAAVDSQEFDVQFMHHEVPAVVNIATLVKRSHILKEECKQLTQRLEQLRESQRHNKYSPVELFRLIEDLRKEDPAAGAAAREQRHNKNSPVELFRLIEDLRKEMVSQRTEISTLKEENITMRTQMDTLMTFTEEKIRTEVGLMRSVMEKRMRSEGDKTMSERLRIEMDSVRSTTEKRIRTEVDIAMEERTWTEVDFTRTTLEERMRTVQTPLILRREMLAEMESVAASRVIPDPE
eukprot:CAMPEP_0201112128 /NCGR_PEP_ID=MMETSP0812-20130820/77056_1 /ASSEMBLY_ACC=CAM_ASM_000668 /TAXON_ID=98059 /ORGANISM="Dinobryon sp., Strain UTEXLB2267" /LENGTH=314 /DNA_ID=CAMNT_0047375387 /DNA_START=44 /DNA_END=986 /DNA_ORIENTATION=-